MYERGVSPEDFIGGKMMLYTIDVMEKKLEKLSKM